MAEPAAAGLAREVRDDLRLLAGCHGLEMEGPGLAFRHPEAEALRWMLAAIAEALRIRAASIPGVRVEAKGLAVAVHYRNVAPAALARLEILFERVIHPRRSKLRLFRGKQVIEILPRVRWNKGECALWIRDRVCPTVPSDVAILYMGDDRTDEVAFDVLSGKATTVRVGPGPSLSAAKYRLADVEDVHRLLSALAAEVRARR